MVRRICFGIVVIGAVQWGLVGIGILLGQSLNVINMLLRPWPLGEACVYIVVGLAALVLIGTRKDS